MIQYHLDPNISHRASIIHRLNKKKIFFTQDAYLNSEHKQSIFSLGTDHVKNNGCGKSFFVKMPSIHHRVSILTIGIDVHTFVCLRDHDVSDEKIQVCVNFKKLKIQDSKKFMQKIYIGFYDLQAICTDMKITFFQIN